MAFFLSLLGWHTLPSHASAEACLTGWSNVQPQRRDGSVRNEFCSVRFKKRSSVRILWLFTIRVTASNFTATVDDTTLRSLTSLTKKRQLVNNVITF